MIPNRSTTGRNLLRVLMSVSLVCFCKYKSLDKKHKEIHPKFQQVIILPLSIYCNFGVNSSFFFNCTKLFFPRYRINI